VARVKYRNQRQALAWLADALAAEVARALRDRGGAAAGVVVTWAPTTEAHRRSRGFDHGELLARAVARRLRLPCRRLLRRTAGPPQTGRPAAARRASGPGFAAAARVDRGGVVVLVDDVVTTGATLRSAAVALREAGVRTVVPAAIARTPARPDGPDAGPVARL
jgi:predicted amidophosphoribosyltransferase